MSLSDKNAWRIAIRTKNKANRDAICKNHGIELSKLDKYAESGICGRCEYFKQLGRKESFLAGVCHMSQVKDYIMVERQACMKFKRDANFKK